MKAFAAKTCSCLLPCLALTLCNSVIAQTGTFDPPVLVPLEIVYELRAGNFGTARSRLKLHVDGDQLSYELTIKPTGLATLFGDALDISAKMRLKEGRILAEEYIKKHRRNKNKEQHYLFEPSRSSVRVLHEGKTYSLETPDGALDEASMQLQLTLDAQRHDGPWYHTAVNNGKLKHYRFTEIGSENIDSVFGEIRVLKIQRTRLRAGEKDEIDYHYWLSPAHRYLPIKVEKLEDGRVKRVLTAQAIDFE